jgi:hypothetical protein
MLAGILGAPPDAGLLERIYDRSQGNAFFAEELVAAGQQDDGRGLPPRLENVVLARIQVLPDDTQAVLRIAAAASRRIEHGLLAAVAQLPEAELLDALRAAVAHQVLVPDPVSETYAFRHALTEEALYGQLLPGERARLHAAFARAISEHPDLVGSNPAAMPAWLAYHWVKAHDLVRALPAAIQAGLQSQAAYAFADAYQHFETALELWDQVPDAAEHATLSRARVLRHAAESAYTAGDPVRAIALIRAALAQVDPGDDPFQAGLLHGRLGGYLAATGGQGAMAEYEQAVALVPPAPPSAERAGVLAAFGEALMVQARYRDSLVLCEEAIAIASQVDAPVEESNARRALGVDLAFLGDLEGGIEQLRAACRIAETVAKVDDLARALTSLAGVLEVFSRLEEAATVAVEGAEVADRQGLARWHGPFLAASAARSLLALGRWAQAEAMLRQAVSRLAPELAATHIYIHTIYAQLDLCRGLVDSAAAHLAVAHDAFARTVTQAWLGGPLSARTAELALLEGRPADASTAVAEGLRLPGLQPYLAASLYTLGLRAAADRAELARARRTEEEELEARAVGHELAAQQRAQASAGTANPAAAALPPRVEAEAVTGDAELARLQGRKDAELWAVAAKAWERLGEPYPTTYARWREAEALLLGGVRERVEPLLRAAYATARELGAAPWRRDRGPGPPRCSTSGLIPRPSRRPHPSRHRRRPTRPHGPRAGGARAGRARPDEPPDRRDAVHQPQDGHRARLQHPRSACTAGSRRPPSPTGSGSSSKDPDRLTCSTPRLGSGRSGGLEEVLGLADQLVAVVGAEVVVGGDPEQVQGHVVGQPPGDRAERLVAVGEVAGVLPQEMADEPLPPTPAPRGLHEGVLELPSDPSDVEHAVAASGPFQVDRGHVLTGAEQEVGWGGVAVQPHLAVLPHPGPLGPAVP